MCLRLDRLLRGGGHARAHLGHLATQGERDALLRAEQRAGDGQRARKGLDDQIDAGAAITAEILQRVPVACKRRRTMRNVGAGLDQNPQIGPRVPTHPGMLVYEHRMSQHRAWRRRLVMDDLDRRHLVRGRQEIIHEALGEELAVPVVGEFLVEGGPNAVRDAPHGQRLERVAAGDRHLPFAVGQGDVAGLAEDAEAGLLQGPHRVVTVDAGDVQHGYTGISTSRTSA